MRKWLLGCLFLVGLIFAITNFSGLAKQGEFDSLIIDFKENIPTAQVSQELADIKLKYEHQPCLLYTSPSPRDLSTSRMPSSA